MNRRQKFAGVVAAMCIGFMIASTIAFAEKQKEVPDHKDPPENRAGAVVSLEFDKPEYFLGENVLLHWRIQNKGDKPFRISMGGYGRTPDANRAIRFKVELIDADGKPCPDPYPNPMNMGGWGSDPTLQPGGEYWDHLHLMRYREVTKPGTYTVKVYHDLGWGMRTSRGFEEGKDSSAIPPEPRNAPVATATVRFLMPDARQARQLVETMMKAPEYGGDTWGKKATGKSVDFALLRYPVYLPLALEVMNGKQRDEALGAMAFPEATAVLLDGMKQGLGGSASMLLLRRMPADFRGYQSRQSYLAERSWTDEHKKKMVAPAWKQLSSDDRSQVITAGQMIQSLGTKDDLTRLIKVMDHHFDKYKNDNEEQRPYPRPATVCGTLEVACRSLLKAGATPPATVDTPGSAVAWLVALNVNEKFRPEGWRETARKLLKHNIPFVQDVALRNHPLTLDEPTAEIVTELLNNDYLPVQAAACILAWKSKTKACGPTLKKLMQTTSDKWIMSNAFLAAETCGVPNDERLEICVDRMQPHNKDWNMWLIGQLVSGSIKTNGHGAHALEDWTSTLATLQPAWREFIAAHRVLLRKGVRFPPSSPPLSQEMFPKHFHMYPSGQRRPWPEW